MIDRAIEEPQQLLLKNKHQRLEALASELCVCATTEEKRAVLMQDPVVIKSLEQAIFSSFFQTFSADLELVMLELMAIEQMECLLDGIDHRESEHRLRTLCEMLRPVEVFYRDMGGLVGYQAMLLCFLIQRSSSRVQMQGAYLQPMGVDLSQETPEIARAIAVGILNLPTIAEIYPVGGAADRLRLCDMETLAPLPAAKLQFCGRTLLEGLIRDLQAREYLYYKLLGQQITTPIAMMTSQDKDNHAQIEALCRENGWFKRPLSSFQLFCQPTVPTVDPKGDWCLIGPCMPLMKPGGHGVIWKAAKDHGVFEWFQAQGRKKMLVRQINNPVAGCDYGLLAFTGIGYQEDKAFGFASCLRQVGSAEGVNVMIASSQEDTKRYCLTNIEYCDFKKFGIEDEPVDQGSCYSKFPSNTNILFADIELIAKQVEQCPIPGMLVNLKNMVFCDEKGNLQEKQVARLESTMQNIADCFVQEFDAAHQIQPKDLKTYLTFNHRRKTISTTKKEFQPDASLHETPEGCYFDVLCNAHELLESYCHFTLPPLPSVQEYLSHGGAFDFIYHPALGPLYRVIAQKIRGGVITKGSEWVLEIAEIDVEQLYLDGSLKIIAERVMGEDVAGEQKELRYSDRVGTCILHNVSVCNLKKERGRQERYWNGSIQSAEGCEIRLLGESQFIAHHVVLQGAMQIVVEDGMRTIAVMQEGQLQLITEPLQSSAPLWTYAFAQDDYIALSRHF